MTDRIAQIRARLASSNAARPWTYDSTYDCIRDAHGETVARCWTCDSEDARIIAAAPDDLAYLVAEVERVASESAWWQKTHATDLGSLGQIAAQRDHYRTACETMQDQIAAKDAQNNRLRSLLLNLQSSVDYGDHDEVFRTAEEVVRASRADIGDVHDYADDLKTIRRLEGEVAFLREKLAAKDAEIGRLRGLLPNEEELAAMRSVVAGYQECTDPLCDYTSCHNANAQREWLSRVDGVK